MSSKKLAKYGLVMALYIILSLAVKELGFGPIQFRLSEALTLLAFIEPLYVLPLTLACAFVNMFSPFGIYDVIFGSLASFLALYSMTKVKNIYIASIFPAIFSFIVGLEIYFLSSEPINFFLVTGQIMISEIIIVTIIGVPIFKTIMKNEYLMNLIKIKDEN